MAGALIYLRHPSGRQRICSEDQLADYKSAGWSEERRVEVTVEAKPKKKKAPAKKKKAE